MNTIISYGKGDVRVYRTHARPLDGITPIPESSFVGRPNILWGANISVEVFGDNFLAAYTEGDNSAVVATDSMKNFIHAQALAYEGATLEGFLHFLGTRFLATYPQMHALRMTGQEIPFAAAPVADGAGGWTSSGVLFNPSHDDHASATIQIERDGDDVRVNEHSCGRNDLHLIKITGSSFASFVRDEFTTLPERKDRPLFIYVDIGWRYADIADMLGDDHSRYVPAEQIRDLAKTVFHEFVSMSIQHLVHEIGTRILQRFPQLAEVSFAAQNRLWDTAATSPADERVKVYYDPRPPYGMIGLTLHRA